MYCKSHDEAMKQAKANANLNQEPWIVFSYNERWHCEPKDTQTMPHTTVFPDSHKIAANS